MYIQHVGLWEFKINKNASETAKKIYRAYDQCVLPRRSSDLDQDALRESVECNSHKTWIQHIPICRYLKKIGKMFKLDVW